MTSFVPRLARLAMAEDLVSRWGPEAGNVVRDMIAAFPERSKALRELEVACRIWENVGFDPEGRALERAEGRREMFRHMRTILSLDPEEIDALAKGAPQGDDNAS